MHEDEGLVDDTNRVSPGGAGTTGRLLASYVSGHGACEATHGTAPKYAGQTRSIRRRSCVDVMMFERIGWTKAASDIMRALEATIAEKVVRYDFARLMDGATEVKTSQFAQAIVDRL